MGEMEARLTMNCLLVRVVVVRAVSCSCLFVLTGRLVALV